MKYYCIEYEECGYYEHSDEQLTICPVCYSFLLPYEDSSIPDFMQLTDVPSATAADAAVGVAGDVEFIMQNKSTNT